MRHQLGRFLSFITWNYLKNMLTENIKVKEITRYKHFLTLHMRLWNLMLTCYKLKITKKWNFSTLMSLFSTAYLHCSNCVSAVWVNLIEPRWNQGLIFAAVTVAISSWSTNCDVVPHVRGQYCPSVIDEKNQKCNEYHITLSSKYPNKTVSLHVTLSTDIWLLSQFWKLYIHVFSHH